MGAGAAGGRALDLGGTGLRALGEGADDPVASASRGRVVVRYTTHCHTRVGMCKILDCAPACPVSMLTSRASSHETMKLHLRCPVLMRYKKL